MTQRICGSAIVCHLDRDEVQPGLGGHSSGRQSLGAARWAEEQHPCRARGQVGPGRVRMHRNGIGDGIGDGIGMVLKWHWNDWGGG